jgi:hypothetical protein
MCALNGCYWIHHKVKEWLWCGVENKGGGQKRRTEKRRRRRRRRQGTGDGQGEA